MALIPYLSVMPGPEMSLIFPTCLVMTEGDSSSSSGSSSYSLSGMSGFGVGSGSSFGPGVQPSRITAFHSPSYTPPKPPLISAQFGLLGHPFSFWSSVATRRVASSQTPVSGIPTAACQRFRPSFQAGSSVPNSPEMDSLGPESGP